MEALNQTRFRSQLLSTNVACTPTRITQSGCRRPPGRWLCHNPIFDLAVSPTRRDGGSQFAIYQSSMMNVEMLVLVNPDRASLYPYISCPTFRAVH